MTQLLDIVNATLTANNIPYEYEYWTSKVTYPYFVGEYREDDYSFEDGKSNGVFTIRGWSRSNTLELLLYRDIIEELFRDMQVIKDNKLCFIRYGGAFTVPTGEEGLYRLDVKLQVSEWKGE